MPQISKQKKDKIAEQILYHLFSVAPMPVFTSAIAAEIARDEEFTKKLLIALRKQSLVVEVNKNASGEEYTKRQRWRLSNTTHSIYLRRQNT